MFLTKWGVPRGFIKRMEAGIFPFYSGMFPLLLLINLYRVYRLILSNHPPTLPWYPDAKKVNETPECPKLLSSLGIDHRRRKTIPLWNSTGEKRVLQGITVCLVSTILGSVWWPGRFQTASRGQVLVFFYRHSTRMYLMKEKQILYRHKTKKIPNSEDRVMFPKRGEKPWDLYAVILFDHFYHLIGSHSQSKNGPFFPNFMYFSTYFPNFYGIFSQMFRKR